MVWEEDNARFDAGLRIYRTFIFEGQSYRGQNTNVVIGGKEFLIFLLF